MILAVLAISMAQLWADQPSSVPAGTTSAEALISELNQKVNLGAYAQIDLPKGYRFKDADAARVLLENGNNPAPPSLVGILAPDDGKWLAVLEFNEIGYVKDLDGNKGDFDEILQAVRNRSDSAGQGPTRVVSVNWQIEPKYDANAHSLEWAFLVEGKAGKVVNHTIALFGRRGVLNITTVQAYKPSDEVADSVPLNDLVKKISFKEGQGYADYQSGDKVAGGGLKELVMGEQPAETAQVDAPAAHNPVLGWVMLVYVVVGCCVASGLGLLAYSKLRKPPGMRSAPYANGHAVSAMQGNGANGSNGRHNSGRPKRVFNYQKYYTDMVMQLSGSSYSWVAPANGHSHPRAAAAPQVAAAPPAVSNQALANANLELIACQNNLIEEQRNLMREQARIIEEKAKLIKEYNQLMEKWSQDIENQFSLKLD